MSHNVTLEGIEIKDLNALRQAVEELNREMGLNMEFIEGSNARIRGYYGDTEKVDAMIRMNDHRYDLGFVKQKDGTYAPRCESMARSDFGRKIGTEQGAQSVEGQACDPYGPQANIGRLVQRVNVITAENEAARAGHTTTRQYDEKTGIMQVIAEVV